MDSAISLPATLGHYRIAGKIGEGGMGEVYRAHDERLDRDVAIKILPARALSDEATRKHFRKEALALSRLNHPNIETIFDFDSDKGLEFIVTEYIPGEGLNQRLASGALPEKDIVRLGSQLADGLAAAHEQSIIHRDLKPSNLRITPDGRLKILDFGIAKLIVPGSFDAATATLSESMRFAGTLPYMAPEQVRGEKLDARTDIWAAGAVLYEMASGQRAFRAPGLHVADQILHQVPAAPSNLNPRILPVLDAVIFKCLDKDPDDRYQSAKELAIDLRRLAQKTATTPAAVPLRRARRKLPWFVGIVVALLAFGLIVLAAMSVKTVLQANRSPRRSMRLTVTLPSDAPLAPAGLVSPGHDRTALALSADGSRLAYIAQVGNKTQICIRDMATGRVTPLPGTEGGHTPFFSPDGTFVGFFAQGKLNKTFSTGGAVFVLADAPNPWGAVWGEDGSIYFNRYEGEGIFRISADGGAVQPATISAGDYVPEVLGRGRGLLVSSSSDISYVVGDKQRKFLATGSHPRYLRTGHLLYTAPQGKLVAVPFDLSHFITGSPVVLAEDLRTAHYGVAQFTVADDGTLIYASGRPQGLTSFVWVDRTGKTRSLGLPEASYAAYALSPDGNRLAYTLEGEIWLYDLLRGTKSRLTPRVATGNAPVNRYPRWTPDSRHIVYLRTQVSQHQLVWASLDGSVEAVELWSSKDTGPEWLYPMGFSPDGSILSLFGPSKKTSHDLYVMRVKGPDGSLRKSEPEVFLGNRFGEVFGQISPDGHWMLFNSDQSGTYEIYVTSYPKPGPIRQISNNGGREPIWNPRAPEILYLRGMRMYAVNVTLEPEFRVGEPRKLFEGQYPDTEGLGYDIARDGEHFLMLQNKDILKPTTTLNVITNLADEVQRRVPPAHESE